MKIQSLSVVVPNKKCINNCKFCVSKMHSEDYTNQMDENGAFYDLYEKDYIKRLEFARDNGCNTIMLTGNSEPQQNKIFLQKFGTMNNNLSKPFRWIEMQTTGVLLDEAYLRFLRNHVGVSTISLSLSNLFDDDSNAEINQTPEKLKINIKELCYKIKKYDFNLRLSLNLSNVYDLYNPSDIFNYAKSLNVNQITFRELYSNDDKTEQSNWINNHKICDEFMKNIKTYITKNGKIIRKLEYGQTVYSINEISTVLDSDCMSKEEKEELKYLILRENCKLYSQWDDKGSLIF